MITVKNVVSEFKNLNTSKLPEILKNDFSFVEENIDLYGEDADIDKYIDLYVQKLNEFVSKQGNIKAPSKIKKNTKEKSKKRLVKRAAKQNAKSKTSKPKAKKEPKPKKEKPPKPIKPMFKDLNEDDIFENKVSAEIKQLKKYKALENKKIKSDELLKVIKSLQKDIAEKNIRKTSKYANMVNKMQNHLVQVYNDMKGVTTIEIDEKLINEIDYAIERFHVIPAITVVKKFLNFLGKENIGTANTILKLINKIKANELLKECPYKEDVLNIERKLKAYTEKGKEVDVSTLMLNGLLGLAGMNKADFSGFGDTNNNDVLGFKTSKKKAKKKTLKRK